MDNSLSQLNVGIIAVAGNEKTSKKERRHENLSDLKSCRKSTNRTQEKGKSDMDLEQDDSEEGNNRNLTCTNIPGSLAPERKMPSLTKDTSKEEQASQQRTDSNLDDRMDIEDHQDDKFYKSLIDMTFDNEMDCCDEIEDDRKHNSVDTSSASSSYPLDGRWQMSWTLYPANSTTFTVHKHIFEMFDHPCEIMLVGPKECTCPSFQWPVAVTSVENPVFQQSKTVISSGVETTRIEWTTTDPQYGEIKWTKLGTVECKSEGFEVNNDDVVSPYPLDGYWELTWKTYPLEPTVFRVQNNCFELFDYMCEIKPGQPENNYCPSFQWPVTVSSIEAPIVQESKSSLPPGMKQTEWPTSITWTISDRDYGEVTWTRIDASSEPSCIRKQKRSWQLLNELMKNESIKRRKEEEELEMKSSVLGKSWDLVEKAIALETEDFKTIARDDILYLAKRLLEAQADFKEKKIPCHVDIAYHHTQSANLETIRTNGLLSRNERDQRNVYSATFNGSAYGDGIYCSTNPWKYACSRYGDTTILLARMKGFEKSVGSYRSLSGSNENDFNTLNVLFQDFCVLQGCKQCIPLFRFEAKFLRKHGVDDLHDAEYFRQKLASFQRIVQNLLDQIFNDNIHTEVDTAWADNSWTTLGNAWAPQGNQTLPVAMSNTASNNTTQTGITTTTTSHLTVKSIENCNSVTELRKIISCNQHHVSDNNAFKLVQAASKRLMTISPSASTSSFLRSSFQIQQATKFVKSSSQFQQATNYNLPIQPSMFAPGRNGQRPVVQQNVQQNTYKNVCQNMQSLGSISQPSISSSTSMTDIVTYVAPDSLAGLEPGDFCKPLLTHDALVAGCTICNESLWKKGKGKVVRIAKCGHLFHRTCVEKSMQQQPYCPICSVPISSKTWRGKMPSGSMKISHLASSCAGHEGHGTIAIHYQIPSGLQKSYHPNPGGNYHSVDLFAYIPDTLEGKKLVVRLKFAFSRGLTFSVETYTRMDSHMVWGNTVSLDLNHKHGQKSGSYPDMSYILNSNIALDRLHVPSSNDLCTQNSPTLITSLVPTTLQHQMQTMIQQQVAVTQIEATTQQQQKGKPENSQASLTNVQAHAIQNPASFMPPKTSERKPPPMPVIANSNKSGTSDSSAAKMEEKKHIRVVVRKSNDCQSPSPQLKHLQPDLSGELKDKSNEANKKLDALLFIHDVEKEFGSNHPVYTKFMSLVKQSKRGEIDIPSVVVQVTKLFGRNNRLLLGFNNFLPEGYPSLVVPRINLADSAMASIETEVVGQAP